MYFLTAQSNLYIQAQSKFSGKMQFLNRHTIGKNHDLGHKICDFRIGIARSRHFKLNASTSRLVISWNKRESMMENVITVICCHHLLFSFATYRFGVSMRPSLIIIVIRLFTLLTICAL